MSNFEIVAYFLIGTLATARVARLVIFDVYPPAAWVRSKWDDLTHESGWNPLFHCAYCLTPYIGALNLVAWVLMVRNGNDLTQGIWVGANVLFGGAYVAAMVVAYDGDD